MEYCGRCLKAGIPMPGGCGKCQQLTRLARAGQAERDEMLRYRRRPGEASPILGPAEGRNRGETVET